MFSFPRPSAFTLVELLVAIAISTILTIVLAALCGSTLLIWQQQTALDERRNAAMAVFGQISRDLRYAELPSDQPNTQLEMLINPSTLAAGYTTPQAAFWQAPSATDQSQGENAIVGYFVQWVASGSPFVSKTPTLCRLLINPSAPDYYLYSTPPQPWVTTALLTADAPATPSSSYVGLIAHNVLGLWMRPLDQNQNPITQTASGAAFSAGTFDSRAGYVSSNGRTYLNALPASMEIAIIVVSSRNARRLTGSEIPPATSSTTFWADINTFYSSLPLNVRQGAQIYSTVINLVNAPQ